MEQIKVKSVSNNTIRPNPNGDLPKVHPTAYIDPSAQIIGNVHIGPRVYVGPNGVIRADESDPDGNVHPIEIAAECNIQDGVIIHALAGTTVKIGPQTSLAHASIIHGPCTIGKNCFIGFKAVVYNAEIKDQAFVSTAAVVQGVDLPQNTLVPPTASITSPQDIKNLTKKNTQANQNFAKKVIKANLILTKGYNLTNQDQITR